MAKFRRKRQLIKLNENTKIGDFYLKIYENKKGNIETVFYKDDKFKEIEDVWETPDLKLVLSKFNLDFGILLKVITPKNITLNINSIDKIYGWIKLTNQKTYDFDGDFELLDLKEIANGTIKSWGQESMGNEANIFVTQKVGKNLLLNKEKLIKEFFNNFK